MVNVKRYVARTAREALAALKAELGADAVVLSNRQVPQGVEIVALPPDQMDALNATVHRARAPEPRTVAAPATTARRAPETSRDDGVSDDFTVTLRQHIARMARQNATAAPAPRSEPQPARSSAPKLPPAPVAASIRPFNPPRVASSREEDMPTPPTRGERSRVEAPAPITLAPTPTPAPAPAPAQRETVRESPRETPRETSGPAQDAANARLLTEISSIKGLLERQLAGFAWGELSRQAPARTQAISDLLEAGFSGELARRLTDDLPASMTSAEVRGQVKVRINRHLPLLDNETDIIDQGGVFAIVGPTGVGKTTTTAKLAARCVVRHGADKLALITTDGYRIGAHEQLRIYGRILGVTVHLVRDAADLRRTLQDLRHKHMVLIDTIGMSHRDKMVVEQAAMLASSGCVRRLLVLNATARGDTLDDVLRAYEGPDLAGCIVSKLDEAASLAPVLDVAIRNELRIFYVANGQRVPEDLHVPNRSYLIHRAMREVAADSPWKLGSEDASLLMASRVGQDDRRGASL